MDSLNTLSSLSPNTHTVSQEHASSLLLLGSWMGMMGPWRSVWPSNSNGNAISRRQLWYGVLFLDFRPRLLFSLDGLLGSRRPVGWLLILNLVKDSVGQMDPSLAQDSPASIASGDSPAPEVFVGNIKLKMDKTDSIAEAFLKSSRKSLRYIPPMTQRDEIIIKPTSAMVEHGSRRWQSTALGYFLGKKSYFPQLEAFVRANWKGLQQVSATANGFYFFQFHTLAYMEEVIEEGPWLFQGQPVVLQPWEWGMSLRQQRHTQIPVWFRFRHLPMEYWTEDGISSVASRIGTPLYSDKIMKNCLRLDFARVCIMHDYNSKLPKHLVVISPILAGGKELPIKVDIEYEWLPVM
ncbi:UNVERIFIED_CONTAM: hypothetical protein Sradi_7151800 [Sesamum radiatum]|uniref:DUF4283 domain-containing protein n=1 Tax=Sesamum radiatum TaxID=300843 RepID=A0AAW2IVW0_SESRA